MGFESSKHHETTLSGSTMLKAIKNNIIMRPHNSKYHDITPNGPTMLETQKTTLLRLKSSKQYHKYPIQWLCKVSNTITKPLANLQICKYKLKPLY